MGRPAAVCTRETSIGEVVIEVINQAAPTACIQPPKFETSVASQSDRNAVPRSGLQEEGGLEAPLVSSEVELMLIGTGHSLHRFTRNVSLTISAAERKEYHDFLLVRVSAPTNRN
jgi:hypothetical protein